MKRLGNLERKDFLSIGQVFAHIAKEEILSGRTFEGHVTRIIVLIQEKTENFVESRRSYRADIEPANSGPSLSFCGQHANYWGPRNPF